MTEREFYNQIGGNYDEALSRLMRDSLIRKFVLKFPSDGSFSALSAALSEERWDDAFGAAHTLKGVALNLAFTRLASSASDLTEALRPQNRGVPDPPKYAAMLAKVAEDYDEVRAAIAVLEME